MAASASVPSGRMDPLEQMAVKTESFVIRSTRTRLDTTTPLVFSMRYVHLKARFRHAVALLSRILNSRSLAELNRPRANRANLCRSIQENWSP